MASAEKSPQQEQEPEEKKLEEEIRVRIDPEAKEFCSKLLGLRYKNVSAGIRLVLKEELKSILRENNENPKDFKPMLDRFK